MANLAEYSSPAFATLVATGLFLGGQARLTPLFTPKLYEQQQQRTAHGMADTYSSLGLSAKAMTTLTGLMNMMVATALVWTPSRRVSAGVGILYFTTGVHSRYKHSVSPAAPLVMMAMLAITILA